MDSEIFRKGVCAVSPSNEIEEVAVGRMEYGPNGGFAGIADRSGRKFGQGVGVIRRRRDEMNFFEIPVKMREQGVNSSRV